MQMRDMPVAEWESAFLAEVARGRSCRDVFLLETQELYGSFAETPNYIAIIGRRDERDARPDVLAGVSQVFQLFQQLPSPDST